MTRTLSFALVLVVTLGGVMLPAQAPTMKDPGKNVTQASRERRADVAVATQFDTRIAAARK